VVLKALTMFGIGNKSNYPPKYVIIKHFYDRKTSSFAFFAWFVNCPYKRRS